VKKTDRNFSLAGFKKFILIIVNIFQKKYHCFDYFIKVYLFTKVKLGDFLNIKKINL